MSILTGGDLQYDAQLEGGQAAEGVIAGPVPLSYSEKLATARDTLIVFSMQIVFRATMFLRHLNY